MGQCCKGRESAGGQSRLRGKDGTVRNDGLHKNYIVYT